MGGGTGIFGFALEGSTSEPLIFFWLASMSSAFELIYSTGASVTTTDSLPENEGETRCSTGSSLATGLGFGFTSGEKFKSILFGASSLGALTVWSF